MGMYCIKITKNNQNKIGEILIENKIYYKNKHITQIMWNKMCKVGEYILFFDNGKFLTVYNPKCWYKTHKKPVNLEWYKEIPIYALRDTILTGKYEPNNYDHLFMSKECMIPKKKYYYY